MMDDSRKWCSRWGASVDDTAWSSSSFVDVLLAFVSIHCLSQNIYWNAVWLAWSVGHTGVNTLPRAGWLITKNYSRLEGSRPAKAGFTWEVWSVWNSHCLRYPRTGLGSFLVGYVAFRKLNMDGRNHNCSTRISTGRELVVTSLEHSPRLFCRRNPR